jgi:sporulation protein YlmC with PRC-barrel domain
MTLIRIVRDVLDKKLLDADNIEMGRVDGIVLEFPEGRQPRLVRLEQGGEILARRVANWVVGPTRWLAHHFGPRRSGEIRIDWSKVKRMGRDIHLDMRADDTEALAWEHWMADHFAKKIPGGG